MGTIKELFEKAENGTLTLEQFEKAAADANYKFADLSTGDYVSRKKYDDDISTREKDLQTARDQLTAANGDSEKLKKATEDIAALQEKYNKQAYEYSVRDFANTLKFTSNAAKRDFVNSLTAKNLEIKDGKIMGATDFVENYKKDNSDAFMVEKKEPQQAVKPQPSFVGSTPGVAPESQSKGFDFNFIGVRPRDKK